MNAQKFFYDISVDDFQYETEISILKNIQEYISTKYQYELLTDRTMFQIENDVNTILHHEEHNYNIMNYKVERFENNITVRVQPYNTLKILTLNMQIA